MTTHTPSRRGPVSTTFDQLDWHPVDPRNSQGPQIAALWGDPTKGAFGALLRVPAGFRSPMHTHSHHERVIQLRGRSVHWTTDQTKATVPVMEPGDYMMMPAGLAHVSATTDHEPSVEFITMDGPFDFALEPEVE